MILHDIYSNLVTVTKRQLFATAPRESLGKLKEQLFFRNVSRFALQCFVISMLSVITLLISLFSRIDISPVYKLVCLIQIVMLLLFVLMFDMMGKWTYNPNSFFQRHVDFIFSFIYILSELALMVSGPMEFITVLRFISSIFVISVIPIMKQGKTFLLQLIIYMFLFLWLLLGKFSDLIEPSVFSAFQYWGVCFVCTVFLSATVYSWFVNNFISNEIAENASAELAALNDELENEVKQRSVLLNCVNELSVEMLSSSAEGFDERLFNCLENVGSAIDVQLIHIWRREISDGELMCFRMHEWTAGENALTPNNPRRIVSFPQSMYGPLTKNQSINALVRDFPGDLSARLEALGVVSVIVVPVLLADELWGFVGYGDIKKERHFTGIEEAILRTISLLIATSVMRDDMTKQLIYKTEEALASSNAKSEFLSNMSHEIRTPINAVTGMSVLARKAKDPDELMRCLDRIDAASRQLLAIINDVLDMSKIESGKIELAEVPFTLLSILHNVQSIIAVQAKDKGVGFDTEFSDNLPSVVVGDDVRLSQILINLLGNAVKFTPIGGKIRLSARNLGSAADGYDDLEFVILDTGIGISAEQQAQLFKKFQQADRGISRKFGGTGLGLSISKNLAELMGGGIELKSTLGEGSCFTVRLSVKRGTADMLLYSAEEKRTETPDLSGFCALLAEDIDINREIVIAMLDETGLQIDEAADGTIAVEMVSINPDRYDLILMDLNMPEMDGYTATRIIRSMDGDIGAVPIIAMTANAFAEDIARCHDAGMNDHVAKPIDYNELVRKIAGALNR